MGPRLRDIHGLDPISWWPPAAGWWIGAALVILVVLLLVSLVRYLVRYPPGSWKQEAWAALRHLRSRRHTLTPKQAASELSELLRRIAIARFGRARAARLSGEEWLEWLREQDPNGFDWPARGRILLQLPYAPDDWAPGEETLDELIRAAQRMVRNSTEVYGRRKRSWWRLRRV
ncbi:MAG TPA: DUF4381 domain-containing protein [Sedimenticola thiotaurini]|uniref:DUF4381 domain-containing protein n=1 Tax=Sedimenticola thiotaurini TaxID=1543721 RepID=A0A831W681_9GAMM|nr:DUF4381 domain-containing protein [Sedimenticola thiotaurini]